MSNVTLRVTVERVPSERGGDALVRRAVVERLAPHGRWVVVRADDDPQAAHERDLEAMRLADRWSARPADGYAFWGAEGSTWVESFGEGERWTPIPQGKPWGNS